MKGGYVDPSIPDPNGPDDAPVIIYGYVPAISLAGIAIVTFFATLVAHLVLTFRRRSWYTLPLPIACFMEMLGYIFRSLSSKKDPYRTSYFVAQYFLIVTAPILITATMYVCLTKILRIVEGSGIPQPKILAKLTPRLTLWVFIVADVVTTIVQVAGAALIGTKTSHHEDPATANNIVLAGIAIQAFFFLIYLTFLSSALWAIQKHRSLLQRNFANFVPALICASILVLTRLIFRLAETAQGIFGFTMTHEVFFGVLEYTPILLAMTVLIVWHPAKPLSMRDEKALSQNIELPQSESADKTWY